MSANNQFGLLLRQRFGPFFLTQFLGAFNDNVFKQALIALIAFHAIAGSDNSDLLINLAAGVFILPFFLFSATAGQLADKFEKSRLIRWIKVLEFFIMCGAAIGFYYENVTLLMIVLFLMGTQSSLFGPVKYGILPQSLADDELVGGNALVETGTYLAILLGIVVGTLLIGVDQIGTLLVPWVLIVVAVLGFLASLQIPLSPSAASDLKINWNLFSETLRILRFARQDKAVFQSVLGISWFWFLGATYIAQLPNYTLYTLGGNEQVYVLLLTLFSVGIGLGSLLCEKMSGHMVEVGLVPFGSIGLTLFGIDLFFADHVLDGRPEALLTVSQFFDTPGTGRVLFDIFMIGVFGGFYSVPLYALIQQRSDKRVVSRIIAANNILNALFMVVSALLAVTLLQFLSIPQLFLVIAILNALVAVYIYTQVPLFLVRFIIWLVVHTLYRVRKVDIEKLPTEGPALVVSNHVGFIDPLIVASCVPVPSRFVMYYKIYQQPGLRWFFELVKAIPIAGYKEDQHIHEQSFELIHQALEDGEVVVIYPEGGITTDGELQPFRPGVEKILERYPVPVTPMALRGLWGSFFSRYHGAAMTKPFRRFWSKIEVVIGETLPAEEATAQRLYDEVLKLRGDHK